MRNQQEQWEAMTCTHKLRRHGTLLVTQRRIRLHNTVADKTVELKTQIIKTFAIGPLGEDSQQVNTWSPLLCLDTVDKMEVSRIAY
jgi:hypothetical protein